MCWMSFAINCRSGSTLGSVKQFRRKALPLVSGKKQRRHGLPTVYSKTVRNGASKSRLLNAAERLNRYLKEPPDTGSKFIRLFSCGTLLTSEEYQQMIAERMENTGKVRGVFELDFDKREFSAVHIMDGWRTWAMRDVSAAVYHATRSQFASSDDKWRKLLDHLSGKEITSAGHLSV